MLKLSGYECYINVYQYPKSKGYYNSHCCSLKEAMTYANYYPEEHRKVVYRIHVKLK